MLEDLSAHVLDISENSTMAGADEVEITIKEDEREDLLLFSVKDNGRGMSPEFVAKVTDPFTTTRTTRRVGMGLPFLRQSAELCGGGLVIDSAVGVGTTITATFQYGSVDRPPLGDMPATIMTLVMGSPNVHWRYRHIINGREFLLDTDEIVEALDGDRGMLASPDVGLWLRDNIREELEALRD
ncbi:ATP-binding protein [Cloacibacillus sp.]|uniref:ATP-binding protein n=1 Tax=Cloacibacillus sp. TaxID=2049023 RepID=UPI0025C08894|nr:ATP-binding protein [Cloacibacillus sp.]MCC8058091.1 ATP-binding protein [Cloacibacillus sp.]